MENLWTKRKSITAYSSKKVLIAQTFDSKKSVLEYKRHYDYLNEEELETLLIAARDEEWTTLDLSSCKLNKLPELLWEITSLRVLYVGNNQYSDDEYNNSFDEISENIGKLENLEALSLAGLSLVKIPKAIKNLKKLVYLDCFHCKFESFPNNLLNKNIKALGMNVDNTDDLITICKLRRLEELYLTWSKVDKLPVELGNLNKLRTLYIVNSHVKEIPVSLMNLTNIKKFVISNTPLEDEIPEAMLKQNAYDLICYICKRQAQDDVYTFNESKMIIVGQGDVGKSCLLQRIKSNTYENKKSTLGIDVKKWTYNRGKKKYTLNIWDFGGQEIYHSTHQFFLTKRSLYIFVWDARAEEEYGRIDYWLKTIQSFAEDSPIIITINKCDKDVTRVNRIDFKEYKEMYPQIVATLDISCKDNIGIGRLRSYIKKFASSLPITKEKWIKSWYEIRKELEELAEENRYITYVEFQAVCKKYSIEREEMRSLSKYLHDLGIILHYQEDKLLKGLIILDPNWATRAVYKILDSQETVLKGRNGILRIDDLPFIWNEQELYPEDKYVFLLKIMEKFQLCFGIDEETYLVAELLENEAINIPKNWDLSDDKCIRLIYKYDFMPAGVMTRFIVKIHEHIASSKGRKLCWKKGVYLKYYSSYASVRMTDTISEKKIEIRVSKNNNSNRDRELLHLVRSNLNDINKTFKKLKVEEFVPCNCSENCIGQFQYKMLCRALESNHLEIQCHESFKNVNILKMMEGIEIMETEDRIDKGYINIQANPVFNNTISVESTNSSIQNTSVNINEIKNSILEIQGDISELKDVLVDEISNELRKDIEIQLDKIVEDMEKIEKISEPNEIIKSGKLNKIKRFLVEFSDENSEIRKMLKGSKNIFTIVMGMLEKFNIIAEKLGVSGIQI